MQTYLFSARNRQADFLADDIRKKGLGDIVYFSSADEALDVEMQGKKISVFLMDEEEKKNLRDALLLLEQCRRLELDSVKIYVFSSSEVARTVLDSADISWAEIILIHPGELMAQKLMLDHPLYEAPERMSCA